MSSETDKLIWRFSVPIHFWDGERGKSNKRFKLSKRMLGLMDGPHTQDTEGECPIWPLTYPPCLALVFDSLFGIHFCCLYVVHCCFYIIFYPVYHFPLHKQTKQACTSLPPPSAQTDKTGMYQSITSICINRQNRHVPVYHLHLHRQNRHVLIYHLQHSQNRNAPVYHLPLHSQNRHVPVYHHHLHKHSKQAYTSLSSTPAVHLPHNACPVWAVKWRRQNPSNISRSSNY